MKTESVLLQSLCVPCANRCRYCLLSWDGVSVGAPWDRSVELARQYKAWIAEHRPELRFSFAFGYSMEHPDLRGALRTLREIGSPQSDFLQCDGMRMRSPAECAALTAMLAEEGVKQLNFTFYGLRDYHDRFAARPGDFDLLLRMARAGKDAGLKVSVSIPLTAESAPQADPLLALLREKTACDRIFLFVPHSEGRGAGIQNIRFSTDDLQILSADALSLLNRELYRPEEEWITGPWYREETKRTLLLSLRGDEPERWEKRSPGEWIAEAEALDEAYYAAFPSFLALAERYGDPDGKRFYRQRDLFHRYRRLYAAEFGVQVYDVMDERRTGSRRY